MIKESTQNIKASLSERLNIFRITKGILLSYIITIPFFLIFSFILTYSDFPEKYVSPIVIAVTVTSILLAGAFSAKRMKSKGWLNGGAVGFLYILVLYIFSSIVSSDFSISKRILSMFLIGVLAGSIGGIFGINLKNKPKKKIKMR